MRARAPVPPRFPLFLLLLVLHHNHHHHHHPFFRCTEYEGDGVHAAAPHVQHLWTALGRMTAPQRRAFLTFVCARSSLPASADAFPMSFKVVEPKPAARADPDAHLPHSQTCFFTLSLPFYSSPEVCFRRLVYAVENATTMDDDFQNREVWGATEGAS